MSDQRADEYGSLNPEFFAEEAPEAVEEQPEVEEAEGGGEGEDVEYVYVDEDGNPVEAPDGDLDEDDYEVVEVLDGEEDAPPAEEETGRPSAETVTVSPEERETRRVRSGSTRRVRDRRSGRKSTRISSRELDPEQMKHAKLKVILLLGSIALIPILMVAILLTYCYKKGWWPFRRRPPKKVFVRNDYEEGRDLAGSAFRIYSKARRLMRQGKDKEAYPLLAKAEKDYDRAIHLMQAWRDKNPDPGYYFVDDRITDANMKVRAVRNQKFILDQRRAMNR